MIGSARRVDAQKGREIKFFRSRGLGTPGSARRQAERPRGRPRLRGNLSRMLVSWMQHPHGSRGGRPMLARKLPSARALAHAYARALPALFLAATLLLAAPAPVAAQDPFAVGTADVTFTDPDRGDRPVPADLYRS